MKIAPITSLHLYNVIVSYRDARSEYVVRNSFSADGESL